MRLSTFRTTARLEETMMRAMMPRIAAADPDPLPAFANDGVPAKARWSLGRRYTEKTGFTLAEVVNG